MISHSNSNETPFTVDELEMFAKLIKILSRKFATSYIQENTVYSFNSSHDYKVLASKISKGCEEMSNYMKSLIELEKL